MTLSEFKKLKLGDQVMVDSHVRDAYGEIWHNAGDIVTIKRFTDDGLGVIFKWSDLGVHYSKIKHLNEYIRTKI